MVKGFIAKSEWKAAAMPFFVYREKKEYDDWLSLDWPLTEVVIFTADQIDEVKVLIDIIFQRSAEHPATALEFLESGASLEALIEIGGETCDWTMTAIQARDALKILEGRE